MINNSDFLFASAHLRAREKGGSAADRLAALSSAKNADELCFTAADAFGVSAEGGLSAVLDRAMLDAVDCVRGAVPDFSVFAPLLYKYDCTNIKTALKCSILSIDFEDKLFSCGSVEKDAAAKAIREAKWNIFPAAMAEAASKAKETYLKTGEARAIDLMLDRACFEDMVRDAADPLICDIISMRADAANTLTSLRIAAMYMPEETAAALMPRALVSGGKIPHSAFDLGLAKLADAAGESIIKNEIVKLSKSPSISFAEAELMFDDAILAKLTEVKYTSFGSAVATRYLLVREAEIMNCRIIAAGNEERIRRAYV